MKRTSSRKMVSRAAFPRLRLAVLLMFSAAVLVIAARNIAVSIHFGRVSALSNVAGKGIPLSHAGLSSAMEQLPSVIEERICRVDIVNDGLRLIMLDLDRRQSEKDKVQLVTSLNFAERYLRHGLACTPANGDLWLRLAMVRFLQFAEAKEVATHFARSQAFAPANANVILSRFELAQNFPPDLLDMTTRAREADFAVLCSPPGKKLAGRLGIACPDAR